MGVRGRRARPACAAGVRAARVLHGSIHRPLLKGQGPATPRAGPPARGLRRPAATNLSPHSFYVLGAVETVKACLLVLLERTRDLAPRVVVAYRLFLMPCPCNFQTSTILFFCSIASIASIVVARGCQHVREQSRGQAGRRKTRRRLRSLDARTPLW